MTLTKEVIYISLAAKHRDDGTMFVTSQSLPYFSVIVADNDWQGVLPLLRKTLEVNMGRVDSIQFIEDRDLIPDEILEQPMPPAFVVAEVVREHARLT